MRLLAKSILRAALHATLRRHSRCSSRAAPRRTTALLTLRHLHGHGNKDAGVIVIFTQENVYTILNFLIGRTHVQGFSFKGQECKQKDKIIKNLIPVSNKRFFFCGGIAQY